MYRDVLCCYSWVLGFAGGVSRCANCTELTVRHCDELCSLLSGVVAAGYLELPEVFKFGAISAVVNILIWVGVCGVWWKANGIY